MTDIPLSRAMTKEHRERLLRIAREAAFPSGTRLFDEGQPADRFWIIRTGTVVLDVSVPGRPSAAVDSLGHGELLGWSWHFPPYRWHLVPKRSAPCAPGSSTRTRYGPRAHGIPSSAGRSPPGSARWWRIGCTSHASACWTCTRRTAAELPPEAGTPYPAWRHEGAGQGLSPPPSPLRATGQRFRGGDHARPAHRE